MSNIDRRDLFAAAALAGWRARDMGQGYFDSKAIVKNAVEDADALLAALGEKDAYDKAAKEAAIASHKYVVNKLEKRLAVRERQVELAKKYLMLEGWSAVADEKRIAEFNDLEKELTDGDKD